MKIYPLLLLLTIMLPGTGLVRGQAFSSEEDQVLAFPGADGFGKYTSGGRGGKIYKVTNLNDEGPGSLREALRKKEPRIILFAVSGTIELQSSLDINHGDLTIAGQSAPGGGITLKNYPLKVKGDNIIIRYIRSRLGDEKKVQDDAMSCLRNKNIIIDHCSLSWATDECGSFYDNENFSLQWCILSESLNASVHEKGNHGYGGIWGGINASFHHNLIASHSSRLPRFNGARTQSSPMTELVDFRNNIIYNWEQNSSYGGEEARINMVGNYYKAGPATSSNRDRIFEAYAPYGNYYLMDNDVEGFPEVSLENAKGLDGPDHPEEVLAATAFPFVAEFAGESAREAYLKVLANAGANFFRDPVDSRVVEEVLLGHSPGGPNNNGIIDSQNSVGGWPLLPEGNPVKDSDGDGMPDDWELAHGLDPQLPDDSGLGLSLHYTNVEVYLNELVDW